MRVLVVDFESTGKDTATDRITQIGAVLWDPHEKLMIATIEHLLWNSQYPSTPAEVVAITRLPDELLKREGKDPEEVLISLQQTIKEVDFVIAFNKAFDETLFKNECNRHGLTIPKTPWICALFELPYPKKIRGRYLKLQYIATEHQIPLTKETYDSLHSAIGDVKLLLEILKKYDWGEIVEYYNMPTLTLEAHTLKPWGPDGDGGKSKDIAKAAGFKWDGKNYKWYMHIKANEVKAFGESYAGTYDIIQPEEKDIPY